MTRQEAERTVRRIHPNAVANPVEATGESGQLSSYEDAHWRVLASTGMGAAFLGRGLTEDAAWISAAEIVSDDDHPAEETDSEPDV